MKVRIYQINYELDRRYLAYQDLETVLARSNGKIPAQIYDCVYEGELDAKDLEDVFYILNEAKPADYRTRSLSVSDVVEIVHSEENSGFFFCDVFGFQPFPFDKTAVLKKNSTAISAVPEEGK